MTRQTWDDTWTRLCKVVAGRSLCDNRKVGAVIVDESNRPVAVGYNGPPSGFRHNGESCSSWCERRQTGATGLYGLACPSVHAEANALLAAQWGKGHSIYITHPPCHDCAKLVANSGIREIICPDPEPDVRAFLEGCGLIVR